MKSIFYNNTSFISINLSNFNIIKKNKFCKYYSFTSLNLSEFNTIHIQNMKKKYLVKEFHKITLKSP